MDDATLLTSARAVLQRTADELHGQAGPASFEAMKEVLADELARPVRRSRCFVATGITALLPGDSFVEPGDVTGEAAPLPLAEAQRRVDLAADEILTLWGDADPPDLPDSDGDDPSEDAVRTAVYHLLDTEQVRPDDLDDEDDDEDDLDDDEDGDPGDGETDDSALGSVRRWFGRTFGE